MMKLIGYFCVGWLTLSVITSLATHKPLAQCVTSWRMDCE